MKRTLAIVLLVISIVLLGISIAHAQQITSGLNLTLSPSLMDITAQPGDTLKEKFRIRNNGDTPIELSITVDKLDPHSRNGEVVPVTPTKDDPSPSWISFETATLTAQPKEWLEVPFTISIPKTAAFGYYYAFRIGPSKTNTGQNGATTKLLGQIVLPVLLNVQSANAKAALQLVSFGPQSFFNEYLPVNFDVKISNTGNVHIKPSGTIFIQLGGMNTDALDMNPGSGIILPGGVRTFTVPWLDGFLVQQPVMEDGNPKLDKNGHVIMHLAFNWDKLTHIRIGKYSATALLVYDNGTRDVPIEATTTFWVFPYTAFGVALVSLVLIFVVLRFLLKWYIAKEIRKNQKNS